MAKKIKKPLIDTSVSLNKKSEINYPIFCFKYFQDKTLKECSQEQIFSFFERLRKLSELGWQGINTSHKHSFGCEYLSVDKLKPTVLPALITPDVKKVCVFRYTGKNHPFIVLRNETNNNIIHVLMIEANFGDIYDHGKSK